MSSDPLGLYINGKTPCARGDFLAGEDATSEGKIFSL